MRKFQYLLYALKRSYICYIIFKKIGNRKNRKNITTLLEFRGRET